MTQSASSTPPGSGFGEAQTFFHNTSTGSVPTASRPSAPIRPATQPGPPGFWGTSNVLPTADWMSRLLKVPSVSLNDLGVTSLPGLFKGPTTSVMSAFHSHVSTPVVAPSDCLSTVSTCTVALTNNSPNIFTINGVAPRVVSWDPGAQPLIAGKYLTNALLESGVRIVPTSLTLNVADGNKSTVAGISADLLTLRLCPGTPQETVIQSRVVFTHATTYDVLVGTEVMWPLGCDLSMWDEKITWRVDWNT
jgi:hypothetical protein